MLRRLPLLPVIATLATAVPAFPEGPGAIPGTPGTFCPSSYYDAPVSPRVKTGRITIEFEYVAPDEVSSYWRRLLPEDALVWVQSETSASGTVARALAWRKDLPDCGEIVLADPSACMLSLGSGFMVFDGWGRVAPTGESRAIITSVQIVAPSDAPINPPPDCFEPRYLRLEFGKPPVMPVVPSELNTNGLPAFPNSAQTPALVY